MALGRQMEKPREQRNRWTYRGRPTRKAQRLQILRDWMEGYGRTHLADLP
jgi:hypothetical protein